MTKTAAPIRDQALTWRGFDAVVGAIAAPPEARRAQAESERLLADVAHRLRSLTTGVELTAEAVRQATDTTERDQLLDVIVQETARANAYARGLLRTARLDAGMPLEPVACDLDGICRAQVARARTLAPHLQVTQLGGRLPRPVVADAQAVDEILENLLDNARRHAATRIEVSTENRGDSVLIRVVDDGPGMTDEVAAHAFIRFVSLDGRGGSGLGLAICRELARAHGGDVNYRGRTEGFLVALPSTPGKPGTER